MLKTLINFLLVSVLLVSVLVFCFLIPKVSFAHNGIHEIKLIKKGFEPAQLQIDQREIVTFINIDETDRWPASNIHPTHAIYPDFDPKKPLKIGESWSFKFNKSGDFKFHDHLSPDLVGTITVKGKIKSEKISTGIVENITLALRKFYLKLFPQKLEEELKSFNAVDTAKNEAELKRWISLIGGQKFIQKMVADSKGGSIADCHQEAHLAGRMAFNLEGSRVFKSLDYNCHSGFLHGALEAFITRTGGKDLTRQVTKLCESLNTDFTKFECLHGIGHGFAAYLSYDVPQALKLCGDLETEFAKRSCYGGVFMENIMVAQGQGAIPAHKTNWASDDPHFPCNAVDKDYLVQYECYQIQTARMLHLSNYSWDFVRSECVKSPEDMLGVCFKSMGRDVAGQVLRDPIKIKKLCDSVPKEYFIDCIQGSFNVVAEFWGENMQSQPHEVCNLLEEKEKSYCYNWLGIKLNEIFGINKDKINQICAFSEKDYINTCLDASKKI